MTAADREAFDDLIDSYYAQLKRYARTLCLVNLASHEDVVNEAMAYLMERSLPWASMTEDEAGMACRRACVAAKKELGRRLRRNLQREPSIGLVVDLCAYDYSFCDLAERSDGDSHDLRSLFGSARLNSRERQVMLVKTMDCKVSFQEVADLLELSRKQVEWAFYQARKKLKSALEAIEEVRDDG